MRLLQRHWNVVYFVTSITFILLYLKAEEQPCIVRPVEDERQSDKHDRFKTKEEINSNREEKKRIIQLYYDEDVKDTSKGTELPEILDMDYKSRSSGNKTTKKITTKNITKPAAKITPSNENLKVDQRKEVRSTTAQSSVSHSKDVDIDEFADILKKKLSAITVKEVKLEPPCASESTIANSCEGSKKCLRMKLPMDIKARIRDLVMPKQLQMSEYIRGILREMAKSVEGHYDVIMASAVSSNHFTEVQTMIRNVHENVIPHVKNFKFLLYSLGLTFRERQILRKYCKCQVLDFPFWKFPDFMRTIKCYSWKPIIMKAHIQQANVLIWGDASARFDKDPYKLKLFIEMTRQRGLQYNSVRSDGPFRTTRRMYHYFGDEPCAYKGMWQVHAGLGAIAREPFVDRVIMEPWVACAVKEDCMCQADGNRTLHGIYNCRPSDAVYKRWVKNEGKIIYGMCHRFDQAAISTIIHKLYQKYYKWIIIEGYYYGVVTRIQENHKNFPDDYDV